MTMTPKNIAEWFTGTQEQLQRLLKRASSRPTVPESALAPIQAPNLDVLTVTQLKTVAREAGLKGYSTLKKADLIRFLQNNER